MGILNVTPDSFSDGGRYRNAQQAVDWGLAMAAAGADIVDVGGESTRPGSVSPDVATEMARVVPVVHGLREASDVLISVDTSDPEVLLAAVAAGADMVNDVRALRKTGALEAAVRASVPVCLMHMQGTPETMQREPRYGNVVSEVLAFLRQRSAACIAAGVPRESLIIDPGFGFGKSLDHNLALLAGLDILVAEGFPVLVGLSRKSIIPQLLGTAEVNAQDRLGGSLALALLAREQGARIVRVHDVGPTVQAFRVMDSIESNS